MSLVEQMKHKNEKDVYRYLLPAHDMPTFLIHCSPVTQSQPLKQYFRTFFALPVEAKHLASQSQPVLTDEWSERSIRSRVIAKELFESIILSAGSLRDALIDPWMQATRYGGVNVAEVCCTSDSLLNGAVTSHGELAVR